VPTGVAVRVERRQWISLLLSILREQFAIHQATKPATDWECLRQSRRGSSGGRSRENNA
jgi:hypothetical protein